MQKRNISIYITDVDLVRRNAQELLALLEDSGVNYTMTVECEDVPEPEADVQRLVVGDNEVLLETHTIRADKGQGYTVPVVIPRETVRGMIVDTPVGVATVYGDGTAEIKLEKNEPLIRDMFSFNEPIGLSIVSMTRPATPQGHL